MKITCVSSFAVLIAWSFAPLSMARETTSSEQAKSLARVLNEALGNIAEAPVLIAPELEKPHGIKGALIIPDQAFSAETFGNLQGEVVPVAQLWTFRSALAREGEIVPLEQLRTVTIREADRSIDLQLYLLGVRKSAQGVVELVVFGSGAEPLLSTALASAADAEMDDQPLKLSLEKNAADAATLRIHVLGQYRAALRLLRIN